MDLLLARQKVDTIYQSWSAPKFNKIVLIDQSQDCYVLSLDYPADDYSISFFELLTVPFYGTEDGYVSKSGEIIKYEESEYGYYSHIEDLKFRIDRLWRSEMSHFGNGYKVCGVAQWFYDSDSYTSDTLEGLIYEVSLSSEPLEDPWIKAEHRGDEEPSFTLYYKTIEDGDGNQPISDF
jgi:hypothetical protein